MILDLPHEECKALRSKVTDVFLLVLAQERRIKPENPSKNTFKTTKIKRLVMEKFFEILIEILKLPCSGEIFRM